MSRKPENFKEPKEIANKATKDMKVVACELYDEEMVFDMKENMMYGILYGLKRSEIINNSRQLSENWGVPEVTEKRLIQLYNSARDVLFNYRLGNIEHEKQKFVERMYRLGAKAEARGDFNSAFKAYDKIAEIAGVYLENDQSKVVLNFVPVRESVQHPDIILGKDEDS